MKIFGQAFSKATRSAIGASTPPARDLSPAGTRDDRHTIDVLQSSSALQKGICSQPCICPDQVSQCAVRRAPSFVSFSLLYSTKRCASAESSGHAVQLSGLPLFLSSNASTRLRRCSKPLPPLVALLYPIVKCNSHLCFVCASKGTSKDALHRQSILQTRSRRNVRSWCMIDNQYFVTQCLHRTALNLCKSLQCHAPRCHAWFAVKTAAAAAAAACPAPGNALQRLLCT